MQDIVVTEDKTKIISKLIKTIDKMRLQHGQPMLEPAVLESLAEGWYDHLSERKIPFYLLGKLYHMALDARAQREYNQPFCIEDILRAWFVYKENQDKKALNKPYKQCSLCNNTGIKTVEINGLKRTIPCDHE